MDIRREERIKSESNRRNDMKDLAGYLKAIPYMNDEHLRTEMLRLEHEGYQVQCAISGIGYEQDDRSEAARDVVMADDDKIGG